MKSLSTFRYAFGYARTLDHLRAWKFVLPKSVKEVAVYLTLQGVNGNKYIGTKLFIYENVPQLKYHNSDVKFTVQRRRVTASTIRFKLEDGSCQFIQTTGLTQRDIRKKITDLTTNLVT